MSSTQQREDVVIIGGGQAGLAMSRCLQDRGIDHVVLERGRVAERWLSERWDSLRLLTPNWQSRLPGFRYAGRDPDGYMSAAEVAGYLQAYARSFDAPVQGETTVLSVQPRDGGYLVRTDRGDIRARSVVIATGQCDTPLVPEAAVSLSPAIHQVTPNRYRNPEQLPAGGVLVVGASATGLQLAEELHAAGRQVTLAVGRHARMPRQYRGIDIMWWLDRMGVLSKRADDMPDLDAARCEPSLQLVGRPDHRTLDLGVLQDRGVRLTGRFASADGGRVCFEEDLGLHLASADARLSRLLTRIDDFAARGGLCRQHGPSRPANVAAGPAPRGLDLAAEGITSVLWATGFRGNYPWLKVPVLDARGRIAHRNGVTAAPGLYALGLTFMRRRKSTFIDGVGDDARALAEHIHAQLADSSLQAA